MIKVYCDVCGKEIEEEQMINESTPWIFTHIGVASLAVAVQEDEFACGRTVVCHSCALKLLKAALEKEKAEIEALSSARKEFGALVKRLRSKRRKMTLWPFCSKYGHGVRFWDDLERGLNPPSRDRNILTKWALDLGLQPNTAEWEAFMDAARKAREEWEVDAKGENDEN